MSLEIIQSEEKKENRMKRNTESLLESWDIIRRANIYILWILEGKKGRKGQKTYLRKEWLIISHIWGEICTSRYMTQRLPTRFNPKKTSLRQIIVKLSKIKDSFESSKRKKFICTRKFPQGYKQTCQQKLQARKECDHLFKVLKEKDCLLRILYLAKLFFRN